MELKAGIYKSTKTSNLVVIAEDGRILYSLYTADKLGVRAKWPSKYKDYKEFVKGQGLIRIEDWKGLFF